MFFGAKGGPCQLDALTRLRMEHVVVLKWTEMIYELEKCRPQARDLGTLFIGVNFHLHQRLAFVCLKWHQTLPCL